MAKLSQERISDLLDVGRDGDSATERGRALEDLVCYIFERVPGVAITYRNQLNQFESEEIDVAVWNDRRSKALDFLPHILLIEAKNWTDPVGSAEVAWFDRKLLQRGLDFGVLVAASGVTGNVQQRTAALQIIAEALREGRRLVVVSGEELAALSDTGDLVTLIKQKLCELTVMGTAVP